MTAWQWHYWQWHCADNCVYSLPLLGSPEQITHLEEGTHDSRLMMKSLREMFAHVHCALSNSTCQAEGGEPRGVHGMYGTMEERSAGRMQEEVRNTPAASSCSCCSYSWQLLLRPAQVVTAAHHVRKPSRTSASRYTARAPNTRPTADTWEHTHALVTHASSDCAGLTHQHGPHGTAANP